MYIAHYAIIRSCVFNRFAFSCLCHINQLTHILELDEQKSMPLLLNLWQFQNFRLYLRLFGVMRYVFVKTTPLILIKKCMFTWAPSARRHLWWFHRRRRRPSSRRLTVHWRPWCTCRRRIWTAAPAALCWSPERPLANSSMLIGATSSPPTSTSGAGDLWFALRHTFTWMRLHGLSRTRTDKKKIYARRAISAQRCATRALYLWDD